MEYYAFPISMLVLLLLALNIVLFFSLIDTITIKRIWLRILLLVLVPIPGSYLAALVIYLLYDFLTKGTLTDW